MCHPDTHPDVSPLKFDELNRAYDLIFDYCKDKPRSLSREAVEQFVRLEIEPHLEGVIPHAA